MITIVLLAAGQSRRFGSVCKLQTLYRGKPLVRHAADAVLETGFPAIAVTADDAVAGLLPEFQIVRSSGVQSQSLRAGLHHVVSDRALIVLGDMPCIDADLLRRIAASLGPSMATDGTRTCPPACIPRSLFPALMALTGETGAVNILKSLPDLNLVSASKRVLQDVDLPEDLLELQPFGLPPRI